MGGLLSSDSNGKQQGRVTAHDKAVLDLKTQRDKLRAYSRKTTALIEKETALARTLAKAGKKQQALLVLKRRKYQQGLLDKTQGLLDNVQELVDGIEFAQMQAQVFAGLKEGAATLRDIQAQVDLGELEEIMDETAEGMARQEEIDQAISGHLSEQDDEEILAELAELQASLAQEAGNVPSMPSVPEEVPSTPVEEQVEQLPSVPAGAPVADEKPSAVLA